MADPYLAIAAIAGDEFMTERMNAAVSQQEHLGNVDLGMPNVVGQFRAQQWVQDNRYIWASSPSWGEKWASALAGGETEPGKNEAVITDQDILSTVQALVGKPPAEEPTE